MNKRGLGRGLGALLGPETEAVAPEATLEIPLDRIQPNPKQPRKRFEPTALAELTQSVKASGVIQPVVVRKTGDRYELIAGERRWRAAQAAGLDRIPAVVREATNAESLELALVENLLREDLNPIESAEGYRQLLADFGWTQEQLGQRIGKDRSSIANALRVLKLPDPIQEDLRNGRLTMGHAISLLSLTTEAEQLKLRDEILAHSWSVRATEADLKARRPAGGGPRRRSVELAALEDALQRALMTRVRIVGNDRRGRIEVTYATADELERLGDLLGGSK
ncbi:MAG: ParB/RepB/Spo0J family partition protein [Candidatus Rokubacteria bacterium]|nr:ParB/RepB/Spo0J family partition protein [Candidatus Rokubacteria bacterium]